MSNIFSLCLALVLGVLAAGLNMAWVSTQARPSQFVALKAPLEAGKEIQEDTLMAIPVPGNLAELKRSLVPFANRSILFGMKAPRSFAAGDVVFQRDIQAPAEASRWEVVGPFQLISVGEKFSSDDQYAARSGDNNVTIAVAANFDEQTRRLLEVIGSNRTGDVRGDESLNIVAVQVVPTKGNERSSQRTNSQNVVYQTVSLQGIANVPRVLLEGDMIRFVIPGSPNY